MKGVRPLAEVRETSAYGSKAVGLGEAVREGLPVPPGVAFSGDVVEAVANGDATVIAKLAKAVRKLQLPFAVRSSAIDEDGKQASFAGQHLTLLNVASVADLASALREIWWSANSDSAISYRQRVGMLTRPSVGVVVQSLLDPEVAGVMFTENPITGADERVVEGAFGLGEAVVAGLVIPDHYRIARGGEVLERTHGDKKIAVRRAPDGGTVKESMPAEKAGKLCLDDDQLTELNELARRCEDVYGPRRDIEWAFADGTLYLLQCRAVTVGQSEREEEASPSASTSAVEALLHVPLFADLDQREAEQVARLFKQRHFAKDEAVIREGSGGSALYLIDVGQAVVTVRGEPVATLGPGDHFGEIALIDEGPRAATVTATTDLVCYGLTLWDFRPLVEDNGVIAWKLLQSLVRVLRATQRLDTADGKAVAGS